MAIGLVVMLIASLALANSETSKAGAQGSVSGEVTAVQFPTDCMGYALGVGQAESNQMSFDTTAPSQVEPGGLFTVRIAPGQSAFPDMNPSPLGPVPVNGLQNIHFMYSLPANASVESVEVVTGTGFGTAGTPSVFIAGTPPPFADRSVDVYEPERIVLFVPEVPKNAIPPTNETFFQLPAVDVTLRATGPHGTNISTRVPGTDEPTSGYVFQARSVAVASVYCWPQGNVQAPLLFQTAISSGSVTQPTTTQVSVEPTVLPAGYEATMSALVNAPSGVVRFNDGGTVLGYAELDEAGVASLTSPLHSVGERSITASFMGSPGFEASTSDPVAVSVTNPADRSAVRVTVNSTPSRIALGNNATEGTATLSVTIEPVASNDVPTGIVNLYDDGVVVGSQEVEAGSASFEVAVPWGGHLFEAEYLGNVDFFPATGATSLAAGYSTSGSAPSAARNLSGSVDLNGASLTVPGSGWTLNSPFRTRPDGSQDIGGLFELSSQSLTVPGGTVNGVLAQVDDVATGSIEAGADADASLDATFVFQVSSVDLGAGSQDLGSTCWFGPFEASFTGTRAGLDGQLTLHASEFPVGFAQAGSCLTASGSSLVGPINSRLAGGATDLSFTFTPPPAAPQVNIAPVIASPSGGAFYGQPVTLTATITLAEGGNFASGNIGVIEFYSGAQLLGTANTVGGVGPTKTATFSAPTQSSPLAAGLPPLPQGDEPLRTRFVPSSARKLNYATSSFSSSPYSIWNALPKAPVGLEVQAPLSSPSGQPTTVTIQMTPAPDSVSAPAPLEGVIKIFDETEPEVALQQVRTTPFDLFAGGVPVQSNSDGSFALQIALAPGDHQLQVMFIPNATSAWWWGSGAELLDLIVVGEARPTSIHIPSESTRNGTEVVQGQPLYLTAQLSPIRALDPFRTDPFIVAAIYRSIDGGPPSDLTLGSDGSITMTIPDTDTPGSHEVKLWYDPFYVASLGFPLGMSNLGFAPSEPITFEYEVVVPSIEEPMTTGTEIESILPAGGANPGPAVHGTAWSQVNGYVSFGAQGTVEYFAENKATDVVTSLGTANVSTSTNATTGRGLARLANPAPTASLPAGAYEVWGVYSPSNANFQPSTSERVTQVVVEEGSKLATNVVLGADPASPTELGTPVTLNATVEPLAGADGVVEFFDGGESIGTAPVIGGVAVASSGSTSLIHWDPEVGEHSYTATFTPSSSYVDGSGSDPLVHHVLPPGAQTMTTLAVSPQGSAYEGDPVTLSATVEPAEASGSVLFVDGDTELGTIPVVEGVADWVTEGLSLGAHDFSAQFIPEGPDFAPSVSDLVPYEITERPEGPIETGTTLEISPEGLAVVGSGVTLTATITPTAAAGTVSFLDGDEVVAGPVAVTDGSAQVVVDQLSVGAHQLIAAFTPDDLEAFEGSASPAQSYEITADFVQPVFVCQGADDVTIGLMKSLVAPPDGILELPVELTANVPDTLSNGGTGEVSFTWSVTLPENLANLAIEAQAAEIYMEAMDLAMVASGGSDEVWEFPATHTITDPAATITLETSGTVTASELADIVYSMRSPVNLTIHVPPTPLVFVDVYVRLTCTVENTTQAITQVEGGTTAPGAPTGVSAEAGPLMAHVSWTPPANDGGSPITGYVVTASPGGKTTHTSAQVTHVDVIGLEEGEDYTFGVQAINEVGQGQASDPSNEVTPGPGENFSDVQPGHPFFAEIEWLAATGITTGMSPGFFGADLNLSRQAMAAFLYRLEGSPEGSDPQCTTMPFTDVALDNTFCGEIQWLKDEGITQGNGDGTFNPTGNLSRQAMSAFLYRLANGPDTPPACTVAPYPDVPTSNVFCPQITWMGEVGITTTPPGDNFRPSDSLTRQAMAAFLYRYTTVIPTEL